MLVPTKELTSAAEIRNHARVVWARRRKAFAPPLPKPPEAPTGPAERLTCAFIVRGVAHFYGVSPAAILSPARHGRIVFVRWVCAYLCMAKAHRGYAAIGRATGRDHSTVMRGIGIIARRLCDDPDLRAEVADIVMYMDDLRRGHG
jgi:chromosomal replication initiation ATPase DnaA